MPINYNYYPADWKTRIRPEILSRAKNACETCGIKNYSIGARDGEGNFYSKKQIELMPEKMKVKLKFKKLIKIILTISHTDHNINNNDPGNLKALCQKCHLTHDIEHHKKNRIMAASFNQNDLPLPGFTKPAGRSALPAIEKKFPDLETFPDGRIALPPRDQILPDLETSATWRIPLPGGGELVKN